MLDLLDGVSTPTSGGLGVHTESERFARQAREAWKVWSTETSRPVGESVPRAFSVEYTRQLRAGRDHKLMLGIIRGAARVPVKANNSDDTRRVIHALKSVAAGRAARALLTTDAPVVPYPHGDHAETKSAIEDVVEACRIPASAWTSEDQDAAGILVAKFTPKDLQAAATKASVARGCDAVTPLDVLRFAHSRRDKPVRTSGAKPGRARATYSAGVEARAAIKDVRFGLDDMANDMLIAGADPAAIRALHAAAPKGYWDAVFELAAEGDSNDMAYNQLVSRFDGWHPSQRA